MTLDFINKRIKEQEEYLDKLFHRWVDGEISEERFGEIHQSAKSQLDYFEQKKKEHEKA